MTMVRRWGVGLLSFGCVAAVAMGCAKKQEMTQVESVPSQQVSPSEVREAVQKLPEPDRSFLQQATGANAAGMEFGRLAMTRGSTQDIRDIGRALVDEHTRIADELRQSAAGNGVTLPYPSMTKDQRDRYDQLSQVTGPDFDHRFLDEIRNIQQETISSFQKEATQGQVPALQSLANNSLPVLNDRVRTVQRELNRF